MAKGGWRYGAGRPGWRRKCEQSLALDVRQLHRKGLLLSRGSRYCWSWTTNYGDPAGNIMVTVEDEKLILDYQWTPYCGDPVSVSCTLYLHRTPCNFGGHRRWFNCPQCWRRCAVVYFGASGGHYACRNCLRLAYLSEGEDLTGRLWRRQRKLESRLGPNGEKPKGMHWRTCERIGGQIADVESRRDALLLDHLGLLDSFSNTDVAEVVRALRSVLGENDMMAYLAMMAVRLLELRRVLKPTGSLYLHCDPTASHYLKIVLDQVFGHENFKNEIIWKRTGSHNSARRFGPVHDVIFYYTVSDESTWIQQRQDYEDAYKTKFGKIDDATGDGFQDVALTGPGIRHGPSGQAWRGFDPTPSGRHW